MIMARSLSWPILFIGSALAITACNEVPLSYGDANSIIAVMSTEAWAGVQDDVYSALEPTVTTVRAEKTFTDTYQEPGAAYWENLRRFRQMVVVGSRDDYWVQEVLEDAREPITENGAHDHEMRVLAHHRALCRPVREGGIFWFQPGLTIKAVRVQAASRHPRIPFYLYRIQTWHRNN